MWTHGLTIALLAMVVGLFAATAPVQASVTGPRMEWFESFMPSPPSAGSIRSGGVNTDAAGNVYVIGEWFNVRPRSRLENHLLQRW